MRWYVCRKLQALMNYCFGTQIYYSQKMKALNVYR